MRRPPHDSSTAADHYRSARTDNDRIARCDGRPTTTAPPPTTTAPPPTTTTAKPGPLFPGRVDAHKEDQERNIGDGAELSGYTATVVSAAFQQSLSSFQDDGYVVADVTILNRDKKTQPFSLFDWRLQTSSGRVIDPTAMGSTLDFMADLVAGGTAAGKVVFEVGAEKGDFYLIYKPDPYDGARGIWKVTVG